MPCACVADAAGLLRVGLLRGVVTVSRFAVWLPDWRSRARGKRRGAAGGSAGGAEGGEPASSLPCRGLHLGVQRRLPSTGTKLTFTEPEREPHQSPSGDDPGLHSADRHSTGCRGTHSLCHGGLVATPSHRRDRGSRSSLRRHSVLRTRKPRPCEGGAGPAGGR